MKKKGDNLPKSNDSINFIKVSGNDLFKRWETRFKDGKKLPEVYFKLGNKININENVNRNKNKEIKKDVKRAKE